MKKQLFPILLLSGFLLVAECSLAKTMSALWSYCVFYSPEKGPYVETYLNVAGPSVQFAKKENGKYQGKISVGISFSKDNVIKYSDKYNLLGPEVSDTLTVNNFIDQQRIPLPDGEYTYHLVIYDLVRPLLKGEKPFEATGTLKVHFPKDSVCFSDIELLESYKPSEKLSLLSKSGYDLVPNVDNYFSKEALSIKYYLELYHAVEILGKENFLITTQVVSLDRKKIFEKASRFQKQEAHPVNVVLGELSLAELPSGNYELLISAFNKENTPLGSQKVFFQRNGTVLNPSAIPDSSGILQFVKNLSDSGKLKNEVRCLRPVSSTEETNPVKDLLKSDDTLKLEKYFSNFWIMRDKDNPEEAWQRYEVQVNHVNSVYGTRIYLGCETDRGRVYLQYGKPNTISESPNEPSAYPYEVWHYYKVKNQTNRKFIFYNPDLVTNDYTLLHSDAIGEIHDDQWQRTLVKRNTSTTDFDTEKQPTHFGGQADDLFSRPK